MVELSVSPVALTLAKGSVQQYTATGRYSDNSIEDLTQAVSWNADNADISSNGLLSATATGTSTITADIDNNSSVTSLTISSADLKSMTIKAPAVIAKGISKSLNATGIFSDGTTQDISNLVIWSSSDTSIARIDESEGLLTAIDTGNVIITASSSNLTTTITIAISDATLTGIAVTPSAISIAKGSSKTISIIALFSDQSFANISKQVIWLNTNETNVEILTSDLSSTNNLLAKNIGSATLTAQFSGFEATSQVTVTSAVLTELTISPANTSIPTGLSQRFSASGLYSDGSIQDLSTQVTWISDNKASAIIDNITTLEGTAHSLSEGDVTISATRDNITDSTNLKVTSAQLNNIEIQPSKQTVAIDFSMPIKAIGHYTDGSKLDITDIAEWSASTPRILNLSNSKEGRIQTLIEGDTLINASLNNISGLAQVFVTSATLQSIQISAAITTIPKALQQQLQAIGTFSDGTTKIISQQVTWQSNTSSLASVDNSLTPGLLQTNSSGETTITASLNDITSEISISITDATIIKIIASVPKSKLDITTNTQATASAVFSDNSSIDITQWSNWTSSASNIASVSNNNLTRGLINAHAAGELMISASFNNISSQELPITVTQNSNNPAAINLTITPNTILNNTLDSTQLQAAVLPTDENGEITDGTVVKFTLLEGDSTRIIEAITTNGIASASITSSYKGLISVTAEISEHDINSSAALFSTDNFENVIGMTVRSNAAFENGKILKGSIFILFARNISNREFTVNQAVIYTTINGTDELIESVEETASLSGGILSSGEYTLIGYELDEDLESDNISIGYSFKDEISGEPLLKGITFSKRL